MAPPPGRPPGPPKQPVQVRLSDDELTLIDTFAADLSRQAFGAAFSRAEALKLAALDWLKQRYNTPPTETATAPSSEHGSVAELGHSIVIEPDTPVVAPALPAPQPSARPTAPTTRKRAHGLPHEVLERIAEERTHCEGLSLPQFAQRLHDKEIYSTTAKDGSRRPVNKGNLKKWLDQAHKDGLL
jgi:hypothetical protein